MECSELVRKKQSNYSYAYRKLAKYFDCVKDVEFIQTLCEKFELNDIEFRSLVSMVDGARKADIAAKSRTNDEIRYLEDQLEVETDPCKKYRL